MKTITPIHPGEILLKKFLKPMHISQNKLGRALGVSPRRINEIVLGKRRITADSALRFAKYFGNTSKYWMGLQVEYDLGLARNHLLLTSKKKYLN